MSSALLGFPKENHAPPRDEDDQKERSSKKVKIPDKDDGATEEGGKAMQEGVSREKGTAADSKSYKESVVGHMEGMDDAERRKEVSRSGEDMLDDEEVVVEGEIEEQKVGDIDCPIFSFSVKEEKRIQQPWKQGVIVQLLGRKIGYRALENKLQQLRVRKGVIQIVDLSHDFYLVTFTSLEDQCRALMEGPWMIYDHYLVVRPWSANFDPASATVSNTAVWVRFSGLPIEYYDSRILHFVGNRIGKTVKVDKNTLLQERGKYARLCVEVDLNKPLLAMFELKERHYKVEYEGLHLLCLACGRFGHYSDGCPDMVKPVVDGGATRESNADGGVKGGQMLEQPWTVVQKPKRNRKGKEGTAATPAAEEPRQSERQVTTTNKGSRFAPLSKEISCEEDTVGENNGVAINANMGNSTQLLAHNSMSEKQPPKSTADRIKGNNNNNKAPTINATRATFKERKGTTHGKKSETLAELLIPQVLDNLTSSQFKAIKKNGVSQKEYGQSNTTRLEGAKQAQMTEPHTKAPVHMEYHRDPGIKESKFFHGPMFDARIPVLGEPLPMHPKNNGGMSTEMEVFVDAKENGESSSEEWDMEIMVEGANQNHENRKGDSSVC
ncbi:hypothetical protein A2U01_0002551 [Trifolium medium]|uniref:CCHC-type domain-containing protein n=1 Tax=Trifolium medium TaxID=97028 RepID=A0A392M3F1_9FABA|nr:hypothetical protein [Trifolium medium]